MSTLSERAFCQKFGSGLKSVTVRKWRREHGFGKGKTDQRGKSLGLTKDDGYRILLRWELRKHGASMLDAKEQPDRIDFDRVGTEYSYLFRRDKRIKGAEHLKLTSWEISNTAPTTGAEELSVTTINLVALMQIVDEIFS